MGMSSVMNAPHTRNPVPDFSMETAPGLFRRLAAGTYDALILLAIWMVATLLVMPFTHGGSFDAFYAQHPVVKLIYQVALLALGYAFFGGFWIHGGQTLGMRAWSLRVVTLRGEPLGWYRAFVRYLSMLIPWLLLLLGCEFLINALQRHEPSFYFLAASAMYLLAVSGWLWPSIDRRRLAWHDHLSGTRMLLMPKTHKVKPV